MSKLRKRTSDKGEGTELFSDEEFDAEEFVDHMDVKAPQHRTDSRSGWRRLEELREQQMLRDQLGELADWNDFDKD